MVQFGKTLNEVVKSDWRCHAVAYMELKRALSESGRGAARCAAVANDDRGTAIADDVNDGPREWVDPSRGNEGVNGCTDRAAANYDDVHSVHTESSYCISDAQKASFFRIYEDSVRRLTEFYEGKAAWAREERATLGEAVATRIAEDQQRSNAENNDGARQLEETREDDPSSSSSSSTSFLVHRINNFSRDLGLALEFLELNATAFSKIMKKFDKRTGSDLREAKLKELRAGHPYLYDGGELRKCKALCVAWIKELQLILQKDSNMVVGHLKGHFAASSASSSGGEVGLSLQNSLIPADRNKSSKPTRTVKEAIDSNGGQNPQESSEMNQNDPLPGAKPSVCFERGVHAQRRAPRSIHKTKEAAMLQNMIERVSEELCLQKADSPFFDKALELERTPPPSFSSSEVELAGALGEGEFCKIYEVVQFKVPESCHICFLHRGFNDPEPSFESPDRVVHRKIPSTVIVDKLNIKPSAGALNQANRTSPSQFSPSGAAAAAATCQSVPKKASFSFHYDANISDYQELESDHEEEEDDYHTTRGFMKDHCLRNGEARYAIKRIRSDLVGQEEITDAAIDLAREAEFLAALKHPNIIRIRGTINVPGHPKYSLVLDRLYDTLAVQMKKWRLDKKRYQGRFGGLIGRNRLMLSKLWMDRLVAAYDLARAMAYLHSNGIIHRDIKPANIGFDVRGDIKIFDFGLAKELKPSEREGEDKYHTDGLAGTRRYMAPEVAQVMPYGLSADVYSFGILMWEMLTLKHAYENHTREKHYKDVIVEGNRPKVSKSWPFVIKNLLERCWHKVPSERPTFKSVCELIKFGMPSDNANVSERSDDLMLRSFRSNQGGVNRTSRVEALDPEHKGVSVYGSMEPEAPSDPLSRSIRLKIHHPDQRKQAP